MSFTPLPKTFTDTCLSLDFPSPQILELGCGDGCFREVLRQKGLKSWGLDLAGPQRGTVADVVADAFSPPVVGRSLDILLVPNILRHLLPTDPSLGFLSVWLDLLKPGGSLFIFEDEPGNHPAPVAHYRDLMEFLRQLLPENRGPLLPLTDFKMLLSTLPRKAHWDFGVAANRYRVDAQAVLGFLKSGNREDPVWGRLKQGIERDGLDPGSFWWARARVIPEGKGS